MKRIHTAVNQVSFLNSYGSPVKRSVKATRAVTTAITEEISVTELSHRHEKLKKFH
jgi:hypothetical protein